jgi:cytoskeletal protein RodZ
MSGDREKGGGLSVQTLVLASLGSATAAVLTSTFWPEGSILSAAVTPLIIALVSEALRRPTERISQVAAARASTSRGERQGPRQRRPETATRGDPRPYSTYGGRRRPPVRLALVLVTGALAFVIAVVGLTLPERIFGGAVANDRPSTIFPRSSEPDRRDERDEKEDPSSTQESPDKEDPSPATPGDTTTTEQPPTEAPAPGQDETTPPSGTPPTSPTTPAPAQPAPDTGAEPVP